MAYYQYHLFFCVNQREGGRTCCQNANAKDMRAYVKQKTKDLGIAGKGHVRVNLAGCMNRCAEGPILVIYPEGVWYSYTDRADLDEIIEEHLLNGKVVERLILPNEQN